MRRERDLWDRMHVRPRIIDSKKNASIVARLKLHGQKPPRDMITEEEAVARSWRAYQDWIAH